MAGLPRGHRWCTGDRVVWTHREGQRQGTAGTVRHSLGTVTAVDLDDLPPGVQVTFDNPADELAPTCYATHAELRRAPR